MNGNARKPRPAQRDNQERVPQQQPQQQPQQPQQPPQQQPPQRPITVDELLDILLQELTDKSTKIPMTQKMLVDVRTCLEIIGDIRNSLPAEIDEARQIVVNRDNIIAEATHTANDMYHNAENRANVMINDAEASASSTIHKAEHDASVILDDANKRAQAMVSQDEITLRASTEARDRVQGAKLEASKLLKQATSYSEDMLNTLEDMIKTQLDDIHQTRQNLFNHN